jgi:50S ribosomal protein L16 3-hydroxylase
MLYDGQHVYINGEALDAGGRDFRLMQQLADTRRLAAPAVARLSDGARALLGEWLAAGWVLPAQDPDHTDEPFDVSGRPGAVR